MTRVANPCYDHFHGIDLSGRFALDAVQDTLQRKPGQGPKQGVPVVWHDHTGSRLMAVGIEKPESLANRPPVFGFLQQTGPHPQIQPGFRFLQAELCVVSPQIVSFFPRHCGVGFDFFLQSFPQRFQAVQLRLGKRIGEAKGDEVGRALLSPVRQISLVTLQFFAGIESAKSRRGVEMEMGFCHVSRQG